MQYIVQTARLGLREFSLEDAALVLSLNQSSEVLRYIPEPPLRTIEEAQVILREMILPQYPRKLGRWAVFTLDKEEFLGWCGLKWIAETGRIDLGYRYKASAWHKGYATEAAAAVLNYGFQQLALREITAHAHIDNIASQKVLEKIGMQYLGEGTDFGMPVKGYTAFNNKH